MISTQDLRNKEVINIYDGKSLGYVYDIEVNLEKGLIEGIIVPAHRSFFSFFGRGDSDYVIKWKDIKRIGDDVILVDVAGILDGDYGYDRGVLSNISSNYDFDENIEDED
jgi:YlmC/YmxH family sporulation protein